MVTNTNKQKRLIYLVYPVSENLLIRIFESVPDANIKKKKSRLKF